MVSAASSVLLAALKMLPAQTAAAEGPPYTSWEDKQGPLEGPRTFSLEDGGPPASQKTRKKENTAKWMC